MNRNQLEKFLASEIKQAIYCEAKIIEALPKVIEAATSDKLKEALSHHLEETEGQMERLKEVCQGLNISPRPEKCEVIDALIEACDSSIRETKDPVLRDVEIIARCLPIEHFEVANYGTICAIAKELEFDDVASLLHETLEEEKTADRDLSKISEGGLISAGLLSEVVQ